MSFLYNYRASWRFRRHLTAFLFAVNEINENPDLLPNITLGFQIHDTCYSESLSIESALRILSGTKYMVPNYNCHKRGGLAAIVGHLLSSLSLSISTIISNYRIPQISYGAMDPSFSDREQFPSFFRTVPNQLSHHQAIIELLKHFGWVWVGIVASADESNAKSSSLLREQLISHGICVEFHEIFSVDKEETVNEQETKRTNVLIKKSTATVIILYCNIEYFDQLMIGEHWEEIKGKVFVTSVTLTLILKNAFHVKTLYPLNGSLLFVVRRGNIHGMKDLMDYVPRRAIRHIEEMLFSLPKDEEGNPLNKSNSEPFRLTYSIYTAVYAVAHAFHDMVSKARTQPGFLSTGQWLRLFHPWQMIPHLNKVQFQTQSDGDFSFSDEGEMPGEFDILNCIVSPDGEVRMAPRSVCSSSCLPGSRKAKREGQPLCCYDCVPCEEGEVSNQTDMDYCMKCPEDQWPNKRRDRCLQRLVEFLSYQDPLGAGLGGASIGLSACAITILGVFIKFRATPVVRANNTNISYTLLVSLCLSFLSCLLFIGQPKPLACMVRQAAFGLAFSIAESSILAKAVTVAVAFRATSPDSQLRRWVGPRLPIYIVIGCSVGQAIICLAWMVLSPPFPDYDIQSEKGKMILICNEGSAVLLYVEISYLGVLALLSFTVAFLVRNLPDRFNEAKYITFSMLVFLSVWVSFIPSYLSTKGKYMVAVEIFAILGSSTGLLACIFIPKMCLILLKRGLSSKVHVAGMDNK
uniref:G-protein coupled receptors family 3 profile domain-containing protein n=1 Tax=Xenopus tropicalis TaxID=8364 RepID=A0A1B8Y4J6_XENTR